MNAPARFQWNDATTVFSPLELQVIALAAASPGECASCNTRDSFVGRMRERLARLLAIHMPGPLANERLEALRLLACNSFARNGEVAPPLRDAALSAGLSDRQIESLRDISSGWRVSR